MSFGVPPFIAERRSIRSFADTLVSRGVLDALVESACLAPSPHHSRPWRFAVIESLIAKRLLAGAMAERWRQDLIGDGVAPARIADLVATSRRRIEGAPAVLLGCLTKDGLDRYPDAERQRAEWAMALLSLGAAVENLLLAASAAGLAACWVAAPAFCPDTARDAIALPEDWIPQAMVVVGYPDPSHPTPDRPPVPLEMLRALR